MQCWVVDEAGHMCLSSIKKKGTTMVRIPFVGLKGGGGEKAVRVKRRTKRGNSSIHHEVDVERDVERSREKRNLGKKTLLEGWGWGLGVGTEGLTLLRYCGGREEEG